MSIYSSPMVLKSNKRRKQLMENIYLLLLLPLILIYGIRASDHEAISASAIINYNLSYQIFTN